VLHEADGRRVRKSQGTVMFTGIILGKGTVVEKRAAGSGMIFSLESDFDLTDPEEGESIAVNGVCLTAKNISAEGLRLMFLLRV
jgi:riboflavin synthase alpha subunit